MNATAVDPATPSAPAKPRRQLPWVVLGVILVQLGVFFGSVYNLQHNTGQMDNKFKDVALEKFMGYMTWINLDLLRGYGFIALAVTLLAWPLVGWYLRHKTNVTRWMILWRSMAVAGGVWAFYILRFFYAKPFFFTLDARFKTIYQVVAGWLPEKVQWWIFDFVPICVVGLLTLHYAHRIVRWFAPHWPVRATRSVGALGVASLAFGSMGLMSLTKPAPKIVKKDPRPNILILASDSLRADHLSCNGYARPTTPAIDALAEKSVNFQKCFVPISSTLESMTSIMTGQFPHTHGLQHMFPNQQQVEHVQQHTPTLANQLGKAGYDTAVLGDWCAGIFDLLPHGFETRDVSTFDNFKVYMTQVVYREHPLLPVFYDNPFGYWMFPGLRSCASFVTPEVVTDRLKQRLTAETSSEKPFFITTFYSTTHIPYRVNPPYNTKFTDPNYRGVHQDAMALDVGAFISDVNVADKWRKLPEPEVNQIVGLYDGCVAKFDDSVKTILEHLKETGLAENTIVIVTADHGDDLFEPNCTFGHGLTFNGGDQNGNVPFILHLPDGRGAGKKVTQLVRTIDFAPTLLDLAGLKPDQRIEGVSLRPYVEQPAADMSLALFAETSYLFCKRYIPNEEPLYMEPMDSTTFVDESFDCHFVLKDKYQDDVLKTKERCLRTQHWKLVFTPGKNKDIWRLFDLRKDTHCEHPVNLEHPVVFQSMQEKLLQWMRDKKECRITDIFPDGEPSNDIVRQ